MSELAKILGTFGPGHELEHAGKVYTFAAIDQRKKATLTAAYYRRARESVYAMREDLGEDLDEAEYRGELDRVADKYTAGDYDFPDGDSLKYFLRPTGMPKLIEVLTGCTLAEAELLATQRDTEVSHIAVCIFTSSFPEVKKKLLQAEEMGALAGKMNDFLLLFGSAPPSLPKSESDPISRPA